MAVSNEKLIQGGSNSKGIIIILNGRSLSRSRVVRCFQGRWVRPESPFSQLSALPPQSGFCLSGTSGLFTKALPTYKAIPKGKKEGRGHVPAWGLFLRWGDLLEEPPSRLLIFSEPKVCSSTHPKPNCGKGNGMRSPD